MRLKWTGARLLLLGAAGMSLLGSEASRLYKKGQRAETAGAIAQAYLFYTEAAAADPRKALYRERADALAPMAALQAQVGPPDFYLPSSVDSAARASGLPEVRPPLPAAPQPDLDLRPEAVFDSITARELAAARTLLPPPRLQPKPGLQNFSIQGDYKSLFEQMAKLLDLKVVFDGDYQTRKPFRFRLEGAEPREALHALEAATGSFIVPIGPKLFLVALDTEAKRKDLEQVETVSVPMPTVLTVQELTEIGQAVKQTVGVEKMFWDGQVNQIVMRDRVSRVLAAQSILNDLTSYRSRVAIDLEFIELNDTQMQEIGVDLQTSFNINYIGQLLRGAAQGSPIKLSELTKLSIGTFFGVGVANVNVVAAMTSAASRNLLKTFIVSTDGQKATFKAGSKYPIVNSQYVGGISSGTSAFAAPPSFTYEDLGIVINVTPHVHGTHDISLDLDTEFKILGATSVNGLPIISNRKMQTTMALKDEEWALVAGLATESKSRNMSGPHAFSHIPLLGHFITHYTGNRSKSYVILALKPRLLSLPADQKITKPVYVGTASKTVTPL